MGNEALCQAEFSGQPQTGKALLETTELIFRPSDGSKPVKIPFSTIKSAKAQNGELQLHTATAPSVSPSAQPPKSGATKSSTPKPAPKN